MPFAYLGGGNVYGGTTAVLRQVQVTGVFVPLWSTGTNCATTATTVAYFPTGTVASGSMLCTLPEGNCPGYDSPVMTGNMTVDSRYLPGRHAGPDRPDVVRRRAAAALARDRARELLLSLLTEEQARTYERDGWFEVRGSDGGVFRIRSSGQAGNVEELTAGRAVASYCCHPPGGLPDADAHVAQMLHLQTDEAGFRRTANRTMLLRRAA